MRKPRAIRLEKLPEKARLQEVRGDLDDLILIYKRERDNLTARIIALP